MSIKLANNAVAHLAATLNTTDTSIVLNAADVANFPILAAGQWHPMTLVSASGNVEIVKVTARSSNILTAVRAQEGTTAASFSAGDRAEIRMTATVVETLQADTAAVGPAAVVAMDAKDAALSASLTALMDSKDAALLPTMDTKDAALHTTITGEIATAKADAISQANTYSDAMLVAAKTYSDTALVSAVSTLNSAISAVEPTGTMKPWPGASAPTGWQFCYGQALSRTTNAALFSLIGTTYGAGDGSTTFNVPDLRGRVPVGKDNMGGTPASRVTTAGSGLDGATLGAAGGAQTQTLTVAQLPSHDHGGNTANDGAHTHSINGGSNISGNSFPSVLATTSGNGFGTIAGGGAHSHGITAQGGGGAHNNVQPSLVINWIIKV